MSQGNVAIESIGSVISAAFDVLTEANPDDPETLERAHSAGYALVKFVNLAVSLSSDGTQVNLDGDGAAMGSAEDIEVAGNQLLRATTGLVADLETAGCLEELKQLRHAVAGLAVSIARLGARLESLEPVANAFAALARETHEPERLATLGYLMDEVLTAFTPGVESGIESAESSRLMHNELNSVAIRSHDSELMECAFDRMAEHMPADLPAFLREAVVEMERADHPEDVKAVVRVYHERHIPPATR
ncbi:hypothetical protein [Thiocapsa bogorovii]|uniref:hypothetical protein n=1 Tax=Thiocapsa bogorovii TaxID=521689 RepID=UPI001E40DD76|nr:hypothetical protein [Thiocapsa bogorovii]UHD17825.1 hypothetical protein LT988_07190 [Thiocapsa bogorovii]